MTLLAKSADDKGAAETLFDHSVRVIETTRQLCDRLPFSAEAKALLRSKLEVAAALHDIGKGASGFQSWLRGQRPNWNRWRHEVLSAAFASGFPEVSDEVIFAVLTHHRQIPRLHERGTLPWFDGLDFGFEGWPGMRAEFNENRDEVYRLWDQIRDFIARPGMKTDATVALAVRLGSEWLDGARQLREIALEKRKEASLIRGLLVSGDHMASGHSELPPMVRLTEFPVGIDPRPFQMTASRAIGHAVLCAPTGSGKTEAGFLWAAANQAENGRLFYVLPYTAAINAMHGRLQRLLKGASNSVGLLHGRAAHHLYASLQRDYPTEPLAAQKEASARAKLAREMYHPVRVCTPQQLLRYTLRGKGWEQMLAEIPGACLIFDEVHSYDPELAGLTLGTARLFASMGAKAMFASATLPQFLRAEIERLFPVVLVAPDATKDGDREIMDRKRHSVEIRPGTLLEAITEIVEEATAGQSVLVVCNHVRSAQRMYCALRDRIGELGILLFHGRFNVQHRREKEQLLADKASLPRVLVATQVVEVSLDISYNRGYLEPAPIDALAQRMGRVNRSGHTPVRIVVAENPINSHPLYSSDLTSDTLRRLASIRRPLSEQDVTEICDDVYANGYVGPKRVAFEERLNHPFFVNFGRTLVAGRHEQWTESVIDKTDGRAEVLPRSLRREYDLLIEQKRWLDADALLVTAPVRRYWQLLDPKTDPWEINLPYDKELGLAEPA
jgi:CRISPR-associated endonuclease/helicase Cas3